MARVARKTVKTAKKAGPKIKRTSQAAMLTEEKHVGSETVDWSVVSEEDIQRKMYETLRHYNYFYDYKDMAKSAVEWVKKNRSKTDLEHFNASETWQISQTLSGVCRMILNGAKFNESCINWVNKKVDEVIAAGKTKKAVKAATPVRTKSPMEAIKERSSDLIASIEEVLDNWIRGDIDKEYSLYDVLTKDEYPANCAKAVADYYAPLRDELVELTKKKTPDLVEAYSFMGVRKRGQFLKYVQAIIDDAERYVGAKKATRKPRAKKVKSSSQIVSGIKYLKDSSAYKIASVDPSVLIDAKEVWLFNTKTRDLTVLRCDTKFTIRGTSLYDFNPDKSERKKLRKPDEFISATLKTTKAKIKKEFAALTTKPAVANGRINQDTILYKAYK